jgi:peptide/nickel transport system permease protein
MNRYLLRRLLTAIPTLLVISFIIFAIISLAPGDPLSQFALNPAVPPEVRENIRKSLGLDQPIFPGIQWNKQTGAFEGLVPGRYLKWVWGLVTQFDFGFSFASRLPVIELIKLRLPTTLWVVGTAYLISIILALPTGIISAVKQYSIFDQVSTTVAFVGASLPTFFTGTIFILVFGVWLKWLPWIYDSTIEIKDFDSFILQIKQSILPIMVLGLFQTASLMRYVRASMLENLPLDYVRTARSKGLMERFVIWRHVLRNSLIPVVTLIALNAPTVVTGALITEQIFRVPGIGSLIVTSVETSDTPVIMATTFISAVLVVFFNIIADVIYAFLDPRIKYT